MVSNCMHTTPLQTRQTNSASIPPPPCYWSLTPPLTLVEYFSDETSVHTPETHSLARCGAGSWRARSERVCGSAGRGGRLRSSCGMSGNRRTLSHLKGLRVQPLEEGTDQT